mmetsp:Transcript_9924/g.28424  ORF Transcript_9924/g.28424 Transcript_9924/m.28424 type:complete len:103 (+) Transcript_9924:230-538(+)|eukprot:CAMPEP_0117674212 /NCGR_PEP_ID=MMETSP0804-20121206/14907_1 /TAXON_ID=1074897 /ORGANISM="Tetraselmis astigmatica, Strain CCMP880" /LENGTH=102 /DNA_ID=CAMNT_0005483045 /DNA_START=211 /DNA_END=519 /DNA_ORIENTATION=+
MCSTASSLDTARASQQYGYHGVDISSAAAGRNSSSSAAAGRSSSSDVGVPTRSGSLSSFFNLMSQSPVIVASADGGRHRAAARCEDSCWAVTTVGTILTGDF